MNPENDPGVSQLLDNALPDAPSDPHGLVRAAMTRGRALRRRQRAGTAVAALAVFGVIGGVAAVVPFGSGGTDNGGLPVASDPTSATPTQPPETPTEPSDAPTAPTAEPDAITIKAGDIPAAVERIVGRQQAGKILESANGTRDNPDEVLAHFLWQGTLTTVIVEKTGFDAQSQCKAGARATDGACTKTPEGDLKLTWGPNLGDGVSGQGVTLWRGDFEVSTLSYNAADGKNSPQLTDQPPLSFDDLTAMATSDVWFE